MANVYGKLIAELNELNLQMTNVDRKESTLILKFVLEFTNAIITEKERMFKG